MLDKPEQSAGSLQSVLASGGQTRLGVAAMRSYETAAGEEVNRYAEETTLLEVVTRQRIVKPEKRACYSEL
jgi:hypothetical protein